MFRKLGIAAVAVVGGLMVLNWAGLSSYSATAFQNIRTHLKKQVPLEFEIQRVRHEIAQLTPDMKTHCRKIAEEMVSVDNLREEIVSTRKSLDERKATVRTMAHDLDNGVRTVVYDGREHNTKWLGARVARDLAACKRMEKELTNKEARLEVKEKALDAARERLATVRTQKEELELLADQMDTELKQVRLAQSQCKFTFDDSRLGRIKETLQEIRNRLNVEVKAAELEGQFSGEATPAVKDGKPLSEVSREVREYLGGATEDGKVASGHK